jgi:signal peptidase I
MKFEKEKVIKEIKSIAIILIIVYFIKSSVFAFFFVPTSSMENTIMQGDFLFGNQLIYGLRTPDWVGIPWTDIGYDLPYYRLPGFEKPEQGDIVIFKCPRDRYTLYVKRCIAGPGDTLTIKARKVFVNGIEFPLSENGKFTERILSANRMTPNIFLGTQGNKDYFKPLGIPQKNDIIPINEETNWELLISLMLLDGHDVTIQAGPKTYEFTMLDPNELLRRKKSDDVLPYFYPRGDLITPWMRKISFNDRHRIYVDGTLLRNLAEYKVKQDYYWMMGDNRDNSFDSRFWGFVPREYIMGKAQVTFFSFNKGNWIPRLARFGTVLR